MSATERPRVLHVLPQLGHGGAGNCVPGVGFPVSTGEPFEHRIVSLGPARVDSDGVKLVDAPGGSALHAELSAADVVHLHFWNAPSVYELLESELPPMRLAIWSHVGGHSPPHVLTPELAQAAERLVVTGPWSLELGLDAELIGPAADIAPFLSRRPTPHDTFDVGYVGTVNFGKLHPGYVAMSARVRAPRARFVVAGSGDAFRTLAAQAEELGVRDRFELLGWVADVPSLLARLDVLGYPLDERSTASGELILQEAMAAGVPPVVLSHGGAARMVRDGVTGLVVDGPDEYARAIDRLAGDPAERERLARGAREHARAEFSLPRMRARWDAVYRELLELPKRAPGPRLPGGPAGAWRFVRSLGGSAPEFAAALTETDEDRLLAAERTIAAAPYLLRSPDSGGILEYRLRYPDDAHLRLWSGLVWREQGRRALAAGEFAAALRLGLDEPRVHAYLREITGSERLAASR